MRHSTRRAGALLALAALLGAACGDDDGGDSANPAGDNGNEVEESASGQDPFKVGLLVELTGNLGFLGIASEQAVEIALEQVNSEGGRQFEVITCDAESDPEAALACYDRLTQRDEVDVILGPGLTPNAEAIADRTDRDQIVNYVLGGSYGQYDMNGHKYQFGAHAVTEDVLAATWRWGEAQGFEDAYMIASPDATGDACRRFFEDEAWSEDAARMELLGQTEMDVTSQTAAPQMAEVSSEADMLFLCVAGGAGVVAMASYAQAGLEMPAVTIHSNGVPFVADALAGKIDDNTVYVPSFCVLAAAQNQLESGFACSESANTFVEEFSAKFPDVTPDILGAAAYDGFMQIADAVNATDGEADSIVDWFESQDAWHGAAGVYSYGPDDHRGLGPESVLIGVYADGGWQLADMLESPEA